VVLEVTRTEEKVGVAGAAATTTTTTTTVAAGGTSGSCGNSSPEVRAASLGGDKRTREEEARPEQCWSSVVDVVSSSPATFSSTTSCLVSDLKYRACPLPLPRLCNVHVACTDCGLHPRNGRVIAHLLSIRNYPLESSRPEGDGEGWGGRRGSPGDLVICV